MSPGGAFSLVQPALVRRFMDSAYDSLGSPGIVIPCYW
jgi:hypothetical protein